MSTSKQESAAAGEFKWLLEPLQVAGPTVRGFGRGSKELGIPTGACWQDRVGCEWQRVLTQRSFGCAANLPVDKVPSKVLDDLATGIYFGWYVGRE